MSTRVIDHVMDLADQLRDQAWEAEKIGKLTDDTVKTMKTAGNIRMLQPVEYGGLEVHPREFAETVMALAALDPSAGWVNGVVGVQGTAFHASALSSIGVEPQGSLRAMI